MLKEKFTAERDQWAIDEFLRVVNEYSKEYDLAAGLLKLLPLPLAKFVIKVGLVDLINAKWRGGGNQEETTLDVINRITDNKDLQAVFAYCWGDYGSPPDTSHFAMQAMLVST